MKSSEFKDLRKKMGLTQTQLADRLGVSLRTIIRIEKSEIVPELTAKAILWQAQENA